MATETITPYPLPGWPYRNEVWPSEQFDAQILRRLGVIEDRLSRIEQMVANLQPKE